MVQVIPEIWVDEEEEEREGGGEDKRMNSHVRNEMDSILSPTTVGA